MTARRDHSHLRIARPTDNLGSIVEMYRDGLEFELLGSFEDHAGFDGAMLGHREAGYHLEFTHQRGHQVGRAPTEDQLLVFYIPDRAEWDRRCTRLEAAGFKRRPSCNPYWEANGATFEDPDGYRVVVQHDSWE